MTELGLKIVELRKQGKSTRAIKAILNCSRATISKYIQLVPNGHLIREHIRRQPELRSLKQREANAEREKAKDVGGTKQTKHNSTMRSLMKRLLVDLRGGRCQICGYDRCLECLSFHHVDPKVKYFNLCGTKLIARSYRVILDELAKCVCICANCHSEVHAGLIECPTLGPFAFTPPQDPKEYMDENYVR